MSKSPPRNALTSIPAELRSFVESTIGSFTLIGEVKKGDSRLWELEARNGERLFLKQPLPGKRRAFERELLAYRDWVPCLPGNTPQLVGHWRGTRKGVVNVLKKLRLPARFPGLLRRSRSCGALLITAVPGCKADTAQLSPQQEETMHVQAGRFLRELHQIPCPPGNTLAPDMALRERAQDWARHAAGLISDTAIEWVLGRVHKTSLKDHRCVPCHWDFHPGNWYVDLGTGKLKLHVIDFGDARVDVWLADLRKMYLVWVQRPDLQAAFLEGYGRDLGSDELDQLYTLIALDTLGRIIWSAGHGYAIMEAQSRNELDRLMDEQF